MMKKFILIGLLLITNRVFAQTDTTIAKNTIYVEGLGNGILGSINYDRLILLGKKQFSFRIGAVYIPLNKEISKSAYSIPIEFNYLLGFKHYLVFGIGTTYAYGFNSDDDLLGNEEVSSAINLNLKLIGYRFQKPSGGLFINLSGLLLIQIVELNHNYKKIRKNDDPFGPWFGLGVGYTFRNKKS